MNNKDYIIISLDLNTFNFNELSPVSSLYTNLFGIYLVIIFISCIILNSILLLVFYRNKELRIPFNMLIIVITYLNLFSTPQFPFVIHSSFSQKWTSSKYGCIFSASMMVIIIISFILFIFINILIFY
jgi:hypothetical protein